MIPNAGAFAQGAVLAVLADSSPRSPDGLQRRCVSLPRLAVGLDAHETST